MTRLRASAGRVGRPHGLDGSFHVDAARRRSCSRRRDACVVGGRARRDRRAAPAPTSGRSCASTGCATREAAEALRGDRLLVPRAERAAARGGRVLGRATSRAARSSTASARSASCERMLRAAVVRGARGRARRRRRAARPAGARRDPRRSTSRRGGSTSTWRSSGEDADRRLHAVPASGSTGSARQRHVAQRARARPRAATASTTATTTPLSGGQVDDTPFGGGAGMVLRVDVVEAALRARYGVDPVELRARAARDRADARRAAARRRARRRAGAPSRR